MKNLANLLVVSGVVLSGCSAGVDATSSSPTEVSDEASSVSTNECVFGKSLKAFRDQATELGFAISSKSYAYSELSEEDREQLQAVYNLADDAAVKTFVDNMEDGELYVEEIQELGGPRLFRLIHEGKGQIVPESGTFVLAHTAAVVGRYKNFDNISGCMVTKLPGLDLRGRECAFGASTEPFASNIKSGNEHTITAKTQLSTLRKAQILAATERYDLNELVNYEFDNVLYQTLEVAGMKEKFTRVWHYPGDNEHGAIFRQGTVDVVARAGDGDIYDCLLAMPRTAPQQ